MKLIKVKKADGQLNKMKQCVAKLKQTKQTLQQLKKEFAKIDDTIEDEGWDGYLPSDYEEKIEAILFAYNDDAPFI